MRGLELALGLFAFAPSPATGTAPNLPDARVSVTSPDGAFELVVRGRLQPRFELEHEAGTADAPHVLQLRRARVQLRGHVFGSRNRYYIQFGFTPRDMTGGLIAPQGSPRINPLRDARLELAYFRDFVLRVGQMKVPFSRERIISDGDLGMIDRSIANEEFNLDRDIGLELRSDDLGGWDGRLGYSLGVFMGEGRNAFELTSSGLLYVARFEMRPWGHPRTDIQVDLERSRVPGVAFGVAYAFHDDAPGERGVHGAHPADGGTTDLHEATADVMLKWRGLGLEGAVHWRRAAARTHGGVHDDEGVPVPLAVPRNGLGGFAQLGWLLPQTSLELVVRYGFVRPSTHGETRLGRADEADVGVNHYFAGHSFKLQADYASSWERALPGLEGEHHRVDRVRVQLQLAF